MAIPNFYCNIPVLNALLQLRLPEEGTDLPLTFDLRELPYYFEFTSDETAWSLRAFARGEVYLHDGSSPEAGAITVDRVTQRAQGSGNRLLQENFGAFFVAARNLSRFARSRGIEIDETFDPELQGILLTLEGENLTWKTVSGPDRPELMCRKMNGGEGMCRPYLDELSALPRQGEGPGNLTLPQEYLAAAAMLTYAEQKGFVCGDDVDLDAAAAFMEKLAAQGDQEAAPILARYRALNP